MRVMTMIMSWLLRIFLWRPSSWLSCGSRLALASWMRFMSLLTTASVLSPIALKLVSIVGLINAVAHFVLEHWLVLSLFSLHLRFLLLLTGLHLERCRVNLEAFRCNGAPPRVILRIQLSFQ